MTAFMLPAPIPVHPTPPAANGFERVSDALLATAGDLQAMGISLGHSRRITQLIESSKGEADGGAGKAPQKAGNPFPQRPPAFAKGEGAVGAKPTPTLTPAAAPTPGAGAALNPFTGTATTAKPSAQETAFGSTTIAAPKQPPGRPANPPQRPTHPPQRPAHPPAGRAQGQGQGQADRIEVHGAGFPRVNGLYHRDAGGATNGAARWTKVGDGKVSIQYVWLAIELDRPGARASTDRNPSWNWVLWIDDLRTITEDCCAGSAETTWSGAVFAAAAPTAPEFATSGVLVGARPPQIHWKTLQRGRAPAPALSGPGTMDPDAAPAEQGGPVTAQPRATTVINRPRTTTSVVAGRDATMMHADGHQLEPRPAIDFNGPPPKTEPRGETLLDQPRTQASTVHGTATGQARPAIDFNGPPPKTEPRGETLLDQPRTQASIAHAI